ncbi:MAG: hypothetical protein ACRDJN_15325, partial [Chloroflexota bacterium]
GVDLGPLLDAHGDYVRAETLAETLTVGPPEPGAHVGEADLDRYRVVLGLRRLYVPAVAD